MTSSTEDGRTKILEVSDLSKDFRGVRALHDYRVSLYDGELLGVIGPNGAGKTTLFNLLTGVVRPTSGRIHFRGRDIERLRPERIAELGVARTFQNIRVFPGLSVLDNVKVALQAGGVSSMWHIVLNLPRFRLTEARLTEEALGLLNLLNLDERRDVSAASLTHGAQRRLEIACALALKPRLLLLDECAAGMTPRESETLMTLIGRVHRDFDLAIMLVEHNMRFVMGICPRVQALDHGELIADGPAESVRRDPKVIEAYLGQSVNA